MPGADAAAEGRPARAAEGGRRRPARAYVGALARRRGADRRHGRQAAIPARRTRARDSRARARPQARASTSSTPARRWRDGELVANGGRVLDVTALAPTVGRGAGRRLSRRRPHRLARRLLPARHRLARRGSRKAFTFKRLTAGADSTFSLAPAPLSGGGGRRIFSAASRTSGFRPLPPASTISKNWRRILGSQKSLMCFGDARHGLFVRHRLEEAGDLVGHVDEPVRRRLVNGFVAFKRHLSRLGASPVPGG